MWRKEVLKPSSVYLRVFKWSLAVPPQASLRKSPTSDGISQGRAASLVPFSCTPVEQGLGLHVALNPKGLRPGCRPLSRPTGGSMNTLAPAPSGSPPLPLGHCFGHSFSLPQKLRRPLPSPVLHVRPHSVNQTSDMEGCVGEESFQLWELNRRLEVYLTRVKTLEEQNQLLSAELGGLRAQSGDASWRARADDELAALRVLVDQRWREKHEAEVQRDNLAEELEGVAGRCQQVRLARDRTSEEVACSRRALEAEKSAQGWLSTRAAELERELEAVRAAHEEERAHLSAQAACAPLRLAAPPRGPPARAPEVEELARRLGEAWRGAVRDYQERVAHMESSLGQARERLGRAMQGAREGRLELLQLQAERDGLQERREALEQRLEGRWQDRLQATEKFQVRRSPPE